MESKYKLKWLADLGVAAVVTFMLAPMLERHHGVSNLLTMK